MVERREAGEPLAWIAGHVTFCGRRIAVDPGVFVPRPQTEELARRAAAMLPPAGRAADLCCGSGAVAAHLAASVPSASVVALDIDPRAVACARRNGLPPCGPTWAPRCGVARSTWSPRWRPTCPPARSGSCPPTCSATSRCGRSTAGPDGLGVVSPGHRRRRAPAASRREPAARGGRRPGRGRGGLLASAGFGTVLPWHDDDGDLRGVLASAEAGSAPGATPPTHPRRTTPAGRGRGAAGGRAPSTMFVREAGSAASDQF